MGSGQHQFKIAAADWSPEFSNPAVDTVVDVPIVLSTRPRTDTNNRVTIATAGCYTFALNATSTVKPVLTVSSRAVIGADPDMIVFARTLASEKAVVVVVNNERAAVDLDALPGGGVDVQGLLANGAVTEITGGGGTLQVAGGRLRGQVPTLTALASGMLLGKTIGLLGVGSIGAHLAATARHFAMSVRGFTRASETSLDVDRYYHGDELLKFADGLDYLVCVLPRTSDTDRHVDEALLNALPRHAVFVNVGRGNAVDEPALAKALSEGRLAAAVLDVFDQEPLPQEHFFWNTPNLYMTYHTSAISYPEDITRVFIENYRLYMEGKPLKYVVDFEKGY